MLGCLCSCACHLSELHLFSTRCQALPLQPHPCKASQNWQNARTYEHVKIYCVQKAVKTIGSFSLSGSAPLTRLQLTRFSGPSGDGHRTCPVQTPLQLFQKIQRRSALMTAEHCFAALAYGKTCDNDEKLITQYPNEGTSLEGAS